MKTAIQQRRNSVRLCAMLLVAIGFATISKTSLAQFGSGPAKEVQLAAKILPASGKLPVRLAITAAIADGWHIYSVTQPKGGPRPTKFSLGDSSDFELVGDFAADTAPVVHVYEDIWPGLNVEEHTGSVTWTAPLKLAAGVDPARLNIAISAKGQVCTKERCKNFKNAFSATVR